VIVPAVIGPVFVATGSFTAAFGTLAAGPSPTGSWRSPSASRGRQRLSAPTDRSSRLAGAVPLALRAITGTGTGRRCTVMFQ